MKDQLFLCLLGLSLLIGSCSKSTTALVGSKSDPAYETGKVQRILVVGGSEKEQVRKTFERELRDQINKKSRAEAMASLEVIDTKDELSRETFLENFRNKNLDAVLVTRVVDAKEMPEFNPGDKHQMVNPYADDFFAYYRRHIVKVPDTGTFNYGRLVQVETNLYETQNGELIWQCVSKSFDQGNTLDVIDDLTQLIVKTLKADKIIR